MTPSSTPPPPSQPRPQYFKPYVSADLQKMAEAFNTSVEQLEVELKKLILDGQIAARIDSHAQVCPRCVSILSKAQLCLWLCACVSVHVCSETDTWQVGVWGHLPYAAYCLRKQAGFHFLLMPWVLNCCMRVPTLSSILCM